MRHKLTSLLITCLLVIALFSSAQAQTYLFSVDKEIVNVYYESDGTMAIDYLYVITNHPSADPIDYVDIGLPNPHYSLSSVRADVDGHPITDITDSPYVTYGVALGLGKYAIQPGKTGRVHFFISGITNVLYEDSEDKNYASAVFIPNWFGSDFVTGSTDITVIFHLPPGVQPEEPKWHTTSAAGFAPEPETGIDNAGRIIYIWRNPNGNAYSQYKFGASFPATYVPASAIVRPSLWERLGIDEDTVFGCSCTLAFFLFFIFISWASTVSQKKRKLKYLPPKIKIEGHGIKRGLTAVEAAVLMEQPTDKVLTMIMFSVLKKGAARVIKKDPLKIEVLEPIPQNLRQYEKDFLEAFKETTKKKQQAKLQDLMIDLIKSVSQKMKGFSHRDTVAYYKRIMEKAWEQVEAADTPEVKSKKFDEYMGWTMLDKDFDDRTKDVFRGQPIFVPTWWGRYDPAWSTPSAPRTSTSTHTSGKGSVSMPSLPTLPGSQFAANVVGGIQSFSSNVIGDLTNFTSRITNKTNPIPKSTTSSRSSWRSSSGGGGCACACACAGCACACAGGGR